MMRGQSRWNVVAWMLGAVLVGSALFSIADHVVLLTTAVSRGPQAGPIREWPF
jgi:hypothetical protein